MQVLNGLLERSDWERAIKMPIGIIPAGTVAVNGTSVSFLSNLQLRMSFAGILSRVRAWIL